MMLQTRSPPQHRHDGTSPLPLGMDWSPPPRKWNGRETVWPHDPTTGWSYCVTIPSWVVLPKSRDSDPVVFYRVQVGVQSPEGITTMRGVLRRFNDFLKLFTVLKKAFPKKSLPPAPPKGLMRLKTRALLEERRCALEDWIMKLLSDIDLSRSVAVASFLELEAAARSSFQEANQQPSESSAADNSSTPALKLYSNATNSLVAGSSSVASDCGSDTAYEASEVGTSDMGRDDSFEVGMDDLMLDEDLTSPIEKLLKYGMANIDEGLFMGQTILDQLEGFPKDKSLQRVNNVMEKDMKTSVIAGNGMELFSDLHPDKMSGHTRKLSSESIGSYGSSLRGSEISNSIMPNSSGEVSFDLRGSAEVSGSNATISNTELQFSGDSQIVVPLSQQQKMNRILLTMQQRLAAAKTDMEDLIARLNQEVAVKDYLATKVKDLEVELETTKQKNKETVQQAISIEREKLTQMQWDMEELRRKSFDMELKLKSKEDIKSSAAEESTDHEKDVLVQELNATKKQLENLSKQYEELEAKSKADIKFLAKEFKSLKSSHTALKQELSQSLLEKHEIEKLLQEEKETSEQTRSAWMKLLHDCRMLYAQLQECNLHLSIDSDGKLYADSSMAVALDLLSKSDEQIGILLAEAKQLAEEDQADSSAVDIREAEGEFRKILAGIIVDNAKLRKQVNSVMHQALQTGSMYKNSNGVVIGKMNQVEE